MQDNTSHSNYKVEDKDPDKIDDRVSLFSGYTDSRPIGAVSLSDFLLQPKYKRQVEVIRGCQDKTLRRALKAKLPAITPSGIFSKRSNAGLIQHSGMICIDIDQKDNPDINDWDALKSTISDFPGLWYAGLSVSGNGLFLIITVKYPDKHLEHFHAITGDLLKKGIAVDIQCSEVSRLRGASYDPQPLYSPLAAPYEKISPGPISTRRAHNGDTPGYSKNQRNSNNPAGFDDRTAYRVSRLVEVIERSGANISDYYPEWFAIGRALASEFGESGRGWFHTISKQSQKYNPAECDEQYTRCLGTCSQTSISTLFYYCKINGITALS